MIELNKVGKQWLKEIIIISILEEYYIAFPIIRKNLIKTKSKLEQLITKSNCADIEKLIRKIDQFVRNTKIACRKIELCHCANGKKDAVELCSDLRFNEFVQLEQLLKTSIYLNGEDYG